MFATKKIMHPFQKFQRHVITNQPGLNAAKRLLLLTVHAFDNAGERGCYATNGRLAFELGTSEGAVRNMIAELEADGFIVRNGSRGNNGVLYRRVVCPYPVIDEERWAAQIYDNAGTKRRPRSDEEIQALLKANADRTLVAGSVVGGPGQPAYSTTEQHASSTGEQVNGNSEQTPCSTGEQRVCSTVEQQTGNRLGIDREKSDLDPLRPGGPNGVFLFSQTPEDQEPAPSPAPELTPEAYERIMQSIAAYKPFNPAQPALPLVATLTS